MGKTAMLNSDLPTNKCMLEPITEDKGFGNTMNKFASGVYNAKRANNYRPNQTI